MCCVIELTWSVSAFQRCSISGPIHFISLYLIVFFQIWWLLVKLFSLSPTVTFTLTSLSTFRLLSTRISVTFDPSLLPPPSSLSNLFPASVCVCVHDFVSTISLFQAFFEDCSCLPMLTGNNTQELGRVIYGHCPLQCNTIVLFVIVLTTCLFLTGVIQNPLLMVTMRSVNHNERSLALGLQFVIVRLLANMPSPIVFGRVIDGACRFWRYESGRRGDCAFVDVRNLNRYMAGR